ncbi:hypothetical protein [Rhizobium sp. P28RR-XV]
MNLVTSFRVSIGILALAGLVAGYYFLNQSEAEAFEQSTTDAYI